MAGFTALPLRDQRLLQWLVSGELVTAELATLLAYGNLRVAQRRLARLVEYEFLRGFWSANSQRPRGRYAYALTKPTRLDLEALIWPNDPFKRRVVLAPSPVIHQLATHDVLAAFLRASGRDGIGLAGWVPEPAVVHWAAHVGRPEREVRPDAMALFRVGERVVVVLIERDLGTERQAFICDKIVRYNDPGWRAAGATNIGLVVDSPRRAETIAATLRRLSLPWSYVTPLPVWIAVLDRLRRDPFGPVWRAPDGSEASVTSMQSQELEVPLPILEPPALLDEDGPMSLDGRAAAAIHWRD